MTFEEALKKAKEEDAIIAQESKPNTQYRLNPDMSWGITCNDLVATDWIVVGHVRDKYDEIADRLEKAFKRVDLSQKRKRVWRAFAKVIVELNREGRLL